MHLSETRLPATLRSVATVALLLVAVLLPYRWAWPVSAMAGVVLIWPNSDSLGGVLIRHAMLIGGSFALVLARTGLDPGWWLPWAAVLIALMVWRRWLQRRTALVVPCIVVAAAMALWRPNLSQSSTTARPRSAILVCAGDSLTAGVDIKGDDDTYVAHLRKRIGCRVINAGAASDRVADLLKRLDRDVLSHKPDVVLLFIGGNDYMDGTPRDAFNRDFNEVVDRIAAVCPRLVIVEVPTGILINPYAGVYRRAAARHGVELVPESWLRWQFIVELLLRDRLNEPLTIDGIHFSPAGAKRVADWLMPSIQRAVQRIPQS